MKIYYIPSKKLIAQDLSKISNITLGKSEVERFLDGDIYVQIKDKTKGEKCLIVGGTETGELLETTFLAHTLKKEGAGEITALIPYMAYARQDRNIEGKSIGIKIIGEILKSSGIKRVIVIDLHSKECKKLFPIPLISMSPYNHFSKTLNIKEGKEFSLVAPDKGAMDNAKYLKKSLKNNSAPIFYIEKIRTNRSIKITSSHGVVLSNVIIVDDILSSGQTLISAVKEIKKRGAKKITLVVSHALFVGTKWKELWSLGVDKIYCTDSVGKRVKDKRIHYIKSANIFYEYFK